MKVIEVDIVVEEGGKIEGQAPPDIAPGKYKAAVEVSDSLTERAKERQPLNIPTIEVDYWPENFSTRREDLYGDDGR